MQQVVSLSQPDLQAPAHPTVLFNTVRTYVPTQLIIEIMLALKLRHRGYNVWLLYDDGVLQHHDTLTKRDFSPYRAFYRWRMVLTTFFLRRVPLLREMMAPYSAYVNRKEVLSRCDGRLQETLAADGIDLTPYVEASLVRFYLSAPDKTVLKSEPDYQKARRMFVENCVLSLAAARSVADKLQPGLLITSHGIYSTWGAFMRYMKEHGLKTICYGMNGYVPNGLDLAVDDIAANKGDGGYFNHLVSNLADRAVSKHEIVERVDSFMARRFE
ncbi:MAG: hypothetical protein AB1744_11685, partial [Candidatus Zixiibacteriota bacterium]